MVDKEVLEISLIINFNGVFINFKCFRLQMLLKLTYPLELNCFAIKLNFSFYVKIFLSETMNQKILWKIFN